MWRFSLSMLLALSFLGCAQPKVEYVYIQPDYPTLLTYKVPQDRNLRAIKKANEFCLKEEDFVWLVDQFKAMKTHLKLSNDQATRINALNNKAKISNSEKGLNHAQ